MLDLCGFTLDEANVDSKAYAFYLHVAFRHQLILQAEQWQTILTAIDDKNVNFYELDEGTQLSIQQFAQAIVTEVNEASQDSWAVKLIKTSYLGNLDRQRSCNDYAIRYFHASNEQNQADLSASTCFSDDRMVQAFTNAIRAHSHYISAISTLPFVLEKACLNLAKNRGCNYQPQKAAEMLAATLDTINKGFDPSTGKKVLIQVILDISFPGLSSSLDSDVINNFTNELIPFINTIIDSAKKLELEKAKIFPENDAEISLARQHMLASLGVHFYSIDTILTQSLIEPVEHCNQAISGAVSLVDAAHRAATDNNTFNRLHYINNIFSEFNNLANACNQLDSSLLPEWIKQANNHYELLKHEVSNLKAVAQSAIEGLGSFYSYAISFIPKVIRDYCANVSVLNEVFKLVGIEDDIELQNKSAIAYFSFYDLAKKSKLDGLLKEKFFVVFMDELVKTNPHFKPNHFKYEDYLALEEQLNKKEHLDLDKPLNQRIGINIDPTQSLVNAFRVQDMTQLNILLLINRLKNLEANFAPKNFQTTFIELAAAITNAENNQQEAYQLFNKRYLLPAAQRLLQQYQTERLTPLVEELLDSIGPSHSLLHEKHKLYTIYSKLKETIKLDAEDLSLIQECWLTHKQIDLSSEIDQCIELANHLPNDKRKPASWLTPKEKAKDNAKRNWETVLPVIEQMLNLLQQSLDKQKKACKQLKSLSQNDTIITLCNSKIAYIDSLNKFINTLKSNLRDPYDELHVYANRLLNAEIKELTLEQYNKLAEASTANNLIRFAWNVLPATHSKQSKLNEIVYNLLNHYFEQSPLTEIINAEQNYTEALNQNPIPALFKELNTPLALTNIIPAQEKMMDVIVDKLVEEGSKNVLSWGTNFLKQAAEKITRQQLCQFLPYPFLADLAIDALQSDMVQASIAPVFNSLINEYGATITDKIDEVREIAKNRLYPILGIEIQKTIELAAYNYLENSTEASTTERDAFAMFYLQYQEIKRNSQAFNADSTIEYLFPSLLTSKQINKRDLIVKFKNKFAELDNIYGNDFFTQKAPEEAINDQLVFLIQHINLSDPANEQLIKLTLLNRFLLMVMENAEQVNPETQIRLQQQAIGKLSEALKKIKDSAELPEVDEEFVLVNDQLTREQMALSLADATKRATKLQLQLIQQQLNATKNLVDKELGYREEMLRSKNLMGKSLAEWKYYKAKFSPKWITAAKVFSFLFEVISFISTWSAIITSAATGIAAGTGVLPAVFIALGLTGLFGPAATIASIAIFATILAIRVTYKFISEIWNRRDEFKDLAKPSADGKKPSVGKQFGLGLLLVLKCSFLAIAKTFFTDYLIVKITTLFALSRINWLRNSFKSWPNKAKVQEEHDHLNTVQTKLEQLQALIADQIKCLDKEKDSTNHFYTNQKIEIDRVKQELIEAIGSIRNWVKNKQDARYIEEGRHFAQALQSFDDLFNLLEQEINRLEQLENAQLLPINDPVVEEPEIVNDVQTREIQPVIIEPTTKPVLVNINAYLLKLKSEQEKQSELIDTSDNNQPTLLSQFCNLFKWPTQVEEQYSGSGKQPMSKTLTKAETGLDSSMVYVEWNSFLESSLVMVSHEDAQPEQFFGSSVYRRSGQFGSATGSTRPRDIFEEEDDVVQLSL